MLDKIHNAVVSLNDSKYFSGLIMIMLNIGSKYITVELSKTQESYLRNSIGRMLLIFSIAWMGTRDIYISLILTSSFIVMTQYLFNENSSLCIIPEYLRELEEVIDINNDYEVSEEELKHAISVLEKAKTHDKKLDQLRMVNSFYVN